MSTWMASAFRLLGNHASDNVQTYRSNGMQVTTELAQHGMVSTYSLNHMSEQMVNSLTDYRYGATGAPRPSLSHTEAHYHS